MLSPITLRPWPYGEGWNVLKFLLEHNLSGCRKSDWAYRAQGPSLEWLEDWLCAFQATLKPQLIESSEHRLEDLAWPEEPSKIPSVGSLGISPRSPRGCYTVNLPKELSRGQSQT